MDPAQALAQLHDIMGRLQAEGAADEEGPIIAALIHDASSGRISPADALRQVQKKMASRGDYH